MISTFNQLALEVRQLPLRSDLAEPPNEDEILEALGQLAVGKAGDMNGLLPDVLKCCGGPLLEYIVVLFRTVWEARHAPLEWRDALLVPVPKKGDLSCCDNWRGISLLDVMGNYLPGCLITDYNWWLKRQSEIPSVGSELVGLC